MKPPFANLLFNTPSETILQAKSAAEGPMDLTPAQPGQVLAGGSTQLEPFMISVGKQKPHELL